MLTAKEYVAGFNVMPDIQLTQDQRSDIVEKLKCYFATQMDQDIGQFDAEFLLDFFAKEVGVFFYNKGVQDANDIIHHKMDDIQQALYDIEQPEPR